MLKTFEIPLDVEKELYTPSDFLFNISRNDFNSVELLFIISQDDTPFDLTGCTVELAIKKPSGLTVYQMAEIQAPEAGTAALILSLQSYIEYGTHIAEIYIRDNDQLIVTAPFYYFSRSAVMETQDIESINDWSALQQALFAYDLKPILIDGVPENLTPEYVGQMAFDTTGKRVFIANGLAVDSWQLMGAGEGGGGGGIVSWTDILGKPTEFTPAAHQHLISDVTGLQLALDAKADIGEGGGAPAEHSHTISDVTGLQLALDSKVDDTQLTGLAPAIHSHTFDSITGKPATYPAAAHNHTSANITDFNTAVSGAIPAEYLTATEGNTLYMPINATPTPAAHTHTATNITDFDTAVAGAIPAEYMTQTESDNRYALKGSEGGTVQPAEWGQITGVLASQTDLQTALNGKADNEDLTGLAPADHTHTAANITDFNTAVAGAIPAEYLTETEGNTLYMAAGATPTPAAHTHTATNITDFNTAVAGAIPAEYLTETEGNTLYMAAGATPTPAAHTHTASNITDFNTAVAGAIPAEYLTETEGNSLYMSINATPTPAAHSHEITEITNLETNLNAKQDKATTGTAAPVATPAYIGQMFVDTTNKRTHIAEGATAGDWRRLAGTNYVDTADNNIINNILGGKKIWTGTKATYDGLTKDANTIYFITG